MIYENPLIEGDKKVLVQVLTKEQQHYRKYVVERLVSAMNQRDQRHDEFDGMTFLENFEFNRKMANSFIPPRKNPMDTVVVSGTARSKMKAIISNIIKLNLETNVLAFDNKDDEDAELGQLLSGMIKKSKELDDDDDKKLKRLYQLFEQGTVFIGEEWVPITVTDKKIVNRGALDPAKGFEGIKWTTSQKTEYKAERRLYSTVEVFLGNIKQPAIEKQPFLYTRQVMYYQEAEAIFGDWSEWKYVQKGGTRMIDDGSDTLPYNNFRLYNLEENQVEVIKYEDLPNNEVQIFINGVMMLPAGFPMYWEWEGYSITMQILDVISDQFAYGKSFMAEIRFDVELQDQILRMLVHKTYQSIKPPTANNTGQTLSPRIYDPGSMIKGIDPTKLARLIEHNGVNNSEYQLYQLIRESIDTKSAVSPTFQGQAQPGQNTATEILEMQRQAQIALGLIIYSVSRMEEKADYLRLYNLLANWTKPIGTEVDTVQNKLKNKYREITVSNANLGGKVGTQKIEMINEVPTQEERRSYSYERLTEERRSKSSFKKSRIILPILQSLKYRFFLKTNPSDRPSDNLNKVLFREKMDQALGYFGQSVNMDYFKRKWALTWGENPQDAFSQMGISGMESLLQTQWQMGKDLKMSPKRMEKTPGVAPELAGTVGATPKGLVEKSL